jgi:choline dehydrogenase
VKLVRDMNSRLDRLGLIKDELMPGPQVQTDDAIRQFIRNEAWGHHASCTNKIGSDEDPMAVLDSRFRVRHTQGLRVVDASVFPKIPGFFIVTPIYMISEKAAEVIAADADATAGTAHG